MECQRQRFFTSVSVVESYRCGCRDLQRRRGRCKIQRRNVAILNDPLWNQYVRVAVVESHATVAQSITFRRLTLLARRARLQPNARSRKPKRWNAAGLDPPSPRGTPRPAFRAKDQALGPTAAGRRGRRPRTRGPPHHLVPQGLPTFEGIQRRGM